MSISKWKIFSSSSTSKSSKLLKKLWLEIQQNYMNESIDGFNIEFMNASVANGDQIVSDESTGVLTLTYIILIESKQFKIYSSFIDVLLSSDQQNNHLEDISNDIPLIFTFIVGTVSQYLRLMKELDSNEVLENSSKSSFQSSLGLSKSASKFKIDEPFCILNDAVTNSLSCLELLCGIKSSSFQPSKITIDSIIYQRSILLKLLQVLDNLNNTTQLIYVIRVLKFMSASNDNVVEFIRLGAYEILQNVLPRNQDVLVISQLLTLIRIFSEVRTKETTSLEDLRAETMATRSGDSLSEDNFASKGINLALQLVGDLLNVSSGWMRQTSDLENNKLDGNNPIVSNLNEISELSVQAMLATISLSENEWDIEYERFFNQFINIEMFADKTNNSENKLELRPVIHTIDIVIVALGQVATQSQAIDVLRTMETILIHDEDSRIKFDECNGYEAFLEMFIRVEENTELLRPCMAASLAAASSNSTSEKLRSPTVFTKDKSSDDVYYTTLIFGILHLVFDAIVIPYQELMQSLNNNVQEFTYDISCYEKFRGRDVRNCKFVELFPKLFFSAHPKLVISILKVCHILLYSSSSNVIALENSGSLESLHILFGTLLLAQNNFLPSLLKDSKINTKNLPVVDIFVGIHQNKMSLIFQEFPFSSIQFHPLLLFKKLLEILQLVSSIQSNTDVSILTYFHAILLHSIDISQVKDDESKTFYDNLLGEISTGMIFCTSSANSSIRKCQNCEIEIADVECWKCYRSGNISSYILCYECDRVFHKSITKRSHIRIPTYPPKQIENRFSDNALGDKYYTRIQHPNMRDSNMSSDLYFGSGILNLIPLMGPIAQYAMLVCCDLLQLNRNSYIELATSSKYIFLTMQTLTLAAIRNLYCDRIARNLSIPNIYLEHQSLFLRYYSSCFQSQIHIHMSTTENLTHQNINEFIPGTFSYQNFSLDDIADFRIDSFTHSSITNMAFGSYDNTSSKNSPLFRPSLAIVFHCIANLILHSTNLAVEIRGRYSINEKYNIEVFNPRSHGKMLDILATLKLVRSYGIDGMFMDQIIRYSNESYEILLHDCQFLLWVMRELCVLGSKVVEVSNEYLAVFVNWTSWILSSSIYDQESLKYVVTNEDIVTDENRYKHQGSTIPRSTTSISLLMRNLILQEMRVLLSSTSLSDLNCSYSQMMCMPTLFSSDAVDVEPETEVNINSSLKLLNNQAYLSKYLFSSLSNLVVVKSIMMNQNIHTLLTRIVFEDLSHPSIRNIFNGNVPLKEFFYSELIIEEWFNGLVTWAMLVRNCVEIKISLLPKLDSICYKLITIVNWMLQNSQHEIRFVKHGHAIIEMIIELCVQGAYIHISEYPFLGVVCTMPSTSINRIIPKDNEIHVSTNLISTMLLRRSHWKVLNYASDDNTSNMNLVDYLKNFGARAPSCLSPLFYIHPRALGAIIGTMNPDILHHGYPYKTFNKSVPMSKVKIISQTRNSINSLDSRKLQFPNTPNIGIHHNKVSTSSVVSLQNFLADTENWDLESTSTRASAIDTRSSIQSFHSLSMFNSILKSSRGNTPTASVIDERLTNSSISNSNMHKLGYGINNIILSSKISNTRSSFKVQEVEKLNNLISKFSDSLPYPPTQRKFIEENNDNSEENTNDSFEFDRLHRAIFSTTLNSFTHYHHSVDNLDKAFLLLHQRLLIDGNFPKSLLNQNFLSEEDRDTEHIEDYIVVIYKLMLKKHLQIFLPLTGISKICNNNFAIQVSPMKFTSTFSKCYNQSVKFLSFTYPDKPKFTTLAFLSQKTGLLLLSMAISTRSEISEIFMSCLSQMILSNPYNSKLILDSDKVGNDDILFSLLHQVLNRMEGKSSIVFSYYLSQLFSSMLNEQILRLIMNLIKLELFSDSMKMQSRAGTLILSYLLERNKYAPTSYFQIRNYSSSTQIKNMKTESNRNTLAFSSTPTEDSFSIVFWMQCGNMGSWPPPCGHVLQFYPIHSDNETSEQVFVSLFFQSSFKTPFHGDLRTCGNIGDEDDTPIRSTKLCLSCFRKAEDQSIGQSHWDEFVEANYGTQYVPTISEISKALSKFMIPDLIVDYNFDDESLSGSSSSSIWYLINLSITQDEIIVFINGKRCKVMLWTPLGYTYDNFSREASRKSEASLFDDRTTDEFTASTSEPHVETNEISSINSILTPYSQSTLPHLIFTSCCKFPLQLSFGSTLPSHESNVRNLINEIEKLREKIFSEIASECDASDLENQYFNFQGFLNAYYSLTCNIDVNVGYSAILEELIDEESMFKCLRDGSFPGFEKFLLNKRKLPCVVKGTGDLNDDVDVIRNCTLEDITQQIGGLDVWISMLSNNMNINFRIIIEVITFLLTSSRNNLTALERQKGCDVLLYTISSSKSLSIELLKGLLENLTHASSLINGDEELQDLEVISSSLLLQLIFDLIMVSPSHIDISISLMKHIQQLCDEVLKNSNIFFEGIGILPVLIFMSYGDFLDAEFGLKLPHADNPSLSILSKSPPRVTKDHSHKHPDDVASITAKLLRTLLLGTSGQHISNFDHSNVSSDISKLPTGFNVSHIEFILIFVLDSVQRINSIETSDDKVTTRHRVLSKEAGNFMLGDHKNKLQTCLISLLDTLILSIEGLQGHGVSSFQLMKNSFGAIMENQWHILLEIYSLTTSVPIKSTMCKLIAITLMNPQDLSIDNKALSSFEKFNGFGMLGTWPSGIKCSSHDEMLLMKSLLGLMSWKCMSAISSNIGIPCLLKLSVGKIHQSSTDRNSLSSDDGMSVFTRLSSKTSGSIPTSSNLFSFFGKKNIVSPISTLGVPSSKTMTPITSLNFPDTYASHRESSSSLREDSLSLDKRASNAMVIVVDEIVIPQLLDSIFKILENFRSYEAVKYVVDVFEFIISSDLDGSAMLQKLIVKSSWFPSVFNCLSSQLKRLRSNYYNGQQQNVQECDEGDTLSELSLVLSDSDVGDADTISRVDFEENIDSVSIQDSFAPSSGLGKNTEPSLNYEKQLTLMIDPLVRLIRVIIMQDIILSYDSSQSSTIQGQRCWNQLFYVPIEESAELHLIICYDILSSVRESMQKVSSGTIFHLVSNISSMIQCLWEHIDISIDFAVKILQSIHYLSYLMPPEIRAKIYQQSSSVNVPNSAISSSDVKINSFTFIRYSLVARVILGRGEDLTTRITSMLEIIPSIQSYLSSSITDNNLKASIQDIYLLHVVLNYFLQTQDELNLLSNEMESKKEDANISHELLETFQHLLEVMQSIIYLIQLFCNSSNECKKVLIRLSDNLDGDPQNNIQNMFIHQIYKKDFLSNEAPIQTREDQLSNMLLHAISGTSKSNLLQNSHQELSHHWDIDSEASEGISSSASSPLTVESIVNGNTPLNQPSDGTQIYQHSSKTQFLDWYLNIDNQSVQNTFKQRVLKEMKLSIKNVDKYFEKLQQKRIKLMKLAQDKLNKENLRQMKINKETSEKIRQSNDQKLKQFHNEVDSYLSGLKKRLDYGKLQFETITNKQSTNISSHENEFTLENNQETIFDEYLKYFSGLNSKL